MVADGIVLYKIPNNKKFGLSKVFGWKAYPGYLFPLRIGALQYLLEAKVSEEDYDKYILPSKRVRLVLPNCLMEWPND